MKRLKGNAMEELVTAGKLKRVDVLVTRSKGGLLGWLIRFGTGSYWNHALMIYTIRSPEDGYDTTFIIESGGAGIDMHNISHYFERPNRYDVGIKRFEAEWFENDIEMGGLRFRRKVRGFALSEIDDKYDYKLILGIVRRITRQLVLAFLFPWQRRKPPEKRRIYTPKFLKRLNVNAYICSGFVQWSYYQGVSKAIEEYGEEDSRIQEVMFNPRLAGSVTEDELLSTTPADLANSANLAWKYIIKDGVVWEVSSQKDVDSILHVK
jgi:hypothetical protein